MSTILGLLIVAPPAHAAEAVDQQSLVGGNNFASTTFNAQSFLPLVDNITGLDFFINSATVAPPFNLTVEVRLRSSDQLIVSANRTDVGTGVSTSRSRRPPSAPA